MQRQEGVEPLLGEADGLLTITLGPGERASGAGERAGRGVTFSFEEALARPRHEVARVALLPEHWRHEGERPLYRVWRGCLPRDPGGAPSPLAGSDVRLDFTLLLPGRFGPELPRTLGHVHRPEPADGLLFGELYQVLAGQGVFVLVASRPARTAVAAFRAGPGDLVVIPPGYGHFTVNAGPGPLLCANLVSRRCLADYAAFARGPVRVWVVDGEGEPRAIVAPATGSASVSVSVIHRHEPHPWVRRCQPLLWDLVAGEPAWVRQTLYQKRRQATASGYPA